MSFPSLIIVNNKLLCFLLMETISAFCTKIVREPNEREIPFVDTLVKESLIFRMFSLGKSIISSTVLGEIQ